MEAESDKWESHRLLLVEAAVLKKDGNTAYASKDFRNAIGKYHRALLHLKAVGRNQTLALAAETEAVGKKCAPEPPKEITAERDRLKSECCNNIAACMLARKDPNYKRIVELCEETLEFDPRNVKASYRMGTALYHLGDLDKAETVLTSNPAWQSEKQIQVLLKSIKEKKKIAEDKVKATYKKMFSSDVDCHHSKESNGLGYSDTDESSGTATAISSEPSSDCGAAGGQAQVDSSAQ